MMYEDWMKDILDAIRKLNDYVPFSMLHDIRNCSLLNLALVNGAMKHEAVVRVVLTVEAIHVRMYGKIKDLDGTFYIDDVDGALCVTTNEDMIAFTRENIDNVEIIDGIITIYLEA